MLTKDELKEIFETTYNSILDKYAFRDVMFDRYMTENGFMNDHDVIIQRLLVLRYEYLRNSYILPTSVLDEWYYDYLYNVYNKYRQYSYLNMVPIMRTVNIKREVYRWSKNNQHVDHLRGPCFWYIQNNELKILYNDAYFYFLFNNENDALYLKLVYPESIIKEINWP